LPVGEVKRLKWLIFLGGIFEPGVFCQSDMVPILPVWHVGRDVAVWRGRGIWRGTYIGMMAVRDVYRRGQDKRKRSEDSLLEG
jgi:hypothetical protein